MPGRGIAVVTGASVGIGAATVRALAAEGFDVVLGARRMDLLEPLAAEVGGRALPLDVLDPSSVAAFAGAVPECRVLVNNAGGAKGRDTVAEADEDRWRWMLEVNFLGTMRVTKAFLPKLEASGDGHVVVVGSIAGFETYPAGAGYTAAKHAERAFTRTLRLELLGHPVRVTDISPGLVGGTEFSQVRFEGDQERARAVYEGLTPLVAEDVASCIAFAVTRPSHVNIDEIVVRPRDQRRPATSTVRSLVLPEPVVRFWMAAMRPHAMFRRTSWGAASADARWPNVWDANVASVLHPTEYLSLREVRAVIEPMLEEAGAPTERIEFLDAETGGSALRELEGSGAEVDADVVMLLDGPAAGPAGPAGPAPAARTREVRTPDDAFWSFYRTVPTFYGDLPDDVLDQMLDRARTVYVPLGLRCFLTTVDAEPAGLASVLVLEGVGYIDNVVTVERFRGRGIASEGVRACVRAAAEHGARSVFLLAEEDGAAQRLYERLGFRVVSRSRSFVRPRPGTDGGLSAGGGSG